MLDTEFSNEWATNMRNPYFLPLRKSFIHATNKTFHAKMGTIKDRNCMDLTEAEGLIRGGKNTWKYCTKKIFMTQITTMV